ncbi:MAG: reverse transcriptase/maturase family protein [Lentisphaerales bacterium]|nr:reverse transcriptase/maturase family protein [Lentisphaerales bacterium]
MLNAIEPIFDDLSSTRRLGFRKGLGCKDTLRTAVSEMNSGRMFVVDVDIKSYFDEIDHDILINLVKTKISDNRILNLIEMFLKQGVIEEIDPDRGSPQRGVISPFLAKIYLDPLDKLLDSQNLHLISYADDFPIMCESQEEAEKALT